MCVIKQWVVNWTESVNVHGDCELMGNHHWVINYRLTYQADFFLRIFAKLYTGNVGINTFYVWAINLSHWLVCQGPRRPFWPKKYIICDVIIRILFLQSFLFLLCLCLKAITGANFMWKLFFYQDLWNFAWNFEYDEAKIALSHILWRHNKNS